MFGAALRDFKAYVALVYDFLVYSVNLMPEYKGVSATLLRREFLKLYAPFYLLEAAKGIALAL